MARVEGKLSWIDENRIPISGRTSQGMKDERNAHYTFVRRNKSNNIIRQKGLRRVNQFENKANHVTFSSHYYQVHYECNNIPNYVNSKIITWRYLLVDRHLTRYESVRIRYVWAMEKIFTLACISQAHVFQIRSILNERVQLVDRIT